MSACTKRLQRILIQMIASVLPRQIDRIDRLSYFHCSLRFRLSHRKLALKRQMQQVCSSGMVILCSWGKHFIVNYVYIQILQFSSIRQKAVLNSHTHMVPSICRLNFVLPSSFTTAPLLHVHLTSPFHAMFFLSIHSVAAPLPALHSESQAAELQEGSLPMSI